MNDVLHRLATVPVGEPPRSVTLAAVLEEAHDRRRRLAGLIAMTVVTAALAPALWLAESWGSRSDTLAGTQPSQTSGRVGLALPSSGWKPGDGGGLALFTGPLHGQATAEGACAWLGDGSAGYLWPEGYRLRLDPLELLAADGRVVAREGDTVWVGGVNAPGQAGERCSPAGAGTIHVQSDVRVGAAPAS